MKVKKKRKKLLVQSALVLLPVFFVLIAAVSLIMYHSVVNSFLEAQNTNMDLTLSRSYDGIVKNNIEDDWVKTWCIDSWEKDPSIMELSESESTELLEKFLEYSDGKESVIGTKEFVDGLTPNVQRYYLRMKHVQIQDNFKYEATYNRYDYLFFIDVSEEHFGHVLFDYDLLRGGRSSNEEYDLDTSKHPAIKKILDGSDKIEFERSEDFPEVGSYYVAYKPMIIDGKVRAVIGIAYDWENFRQAMSSSMFKAQLLGIGGMILAMIVILFVLYRRAVKPVTKIQNAVEKYADDKSSSDIVAKMYEIRSSNELEYLADSISDLALEIDHYTKENIRIASERERAE